MPTVDLPTADGRSSTKAGLPDLRFDDGRLPRVRCFASRRSRVITQAHTERPLIPRARAQSPMLTPERFAAAKYFRASLPATITETKLKDEFNVEGGERIDDGNRTKRVCHQEPRNSGKAGAANLHRQV